MKTSLLIAPFVCLSLPSIAQNNPPQVQPGGSVMPNSPKTETYIALDQTAEFPGGRAALVKYLGANMYYPENALEKKLTGKCFVNFMVNSEGNISNINVSRGVPNCPECDAEAIRLVTKMPKWVPAKVQGNPIDSYFNLPIAFKLAE